MSVLAATEIKEDFTGLTLFEHPRRCRAYIFSEHHGSTLYMRAIWRCTPFCDTDLSAEDRVFATQQACFRCQFRHLKPSDQCCRYTPLYTHFIPASTCFLKYSIGRFMFLRLMRVFDNAMLTYTSPKWASVHWLICSPITLLQEPITLVLIPAKCVISRKSVYGWGWGNPQFA